MSVRDHASTRFIADRMLGTLCRYLRFMGYDVLSANDMREGNRREDTVLLKVAQNDERILLTRDKELARRGGAHAVLIKSEMVLDQVMQLVKQGVIPPDLNLRMVRCSLCNRRLRRATEEEIEKTPYAPARRDDLTFFWCPGCRKLYWMGSHGRNLTERLKNLSEMCEES